MRSKKLVEDLTVGYGIKRGNKTFQSAPIVADSKQVFFLGGLFDAEGWLELDKGRYLRIRLEMESYDIINFVYNSLQSMHLKPRRHNRKDGSHVVSLYRQNDVKCFLSMIFLCHPKWHPSRKIFRTAEAPNFLGYTRPTM